MIAAFARAARVLPGRRRAGELSRRPRGRPPVSSATHLWRTSDGRLLRRYRDGEAAIDALRGGLRLA